MTILTDRLTPAIQCTRTWITIALRLFFWDFLRWSLLLPRNGLRDHSSHGQRLECTSSYWLYAFSVLASSPWRMSLLLWCYILIEPTVTFEGVWVLSCFDVADVEWAMVWVFGFDDALDIFWKAFGCGWVEVVFGERVCVESSDHDIFDCGSW